MKKNKKNKKGKTPAFLIAKGGDAWKKMGMMKYIDLQRNALVRGIDFSELVRCTVYTLQAWLAQNWDNPVNTEKLDEFDYWKEKFLNARGRVHEPFVRLGYIGRKDDNGEIITRKRLKIKKSKKKREKNDAGLYTGTKKSLTHDCAIKGLSFEETVQTVFERRSLIRRHFRP